MNISYVMGQRYCNTKSYWDRLMQMRQHQGSLSEVSFLVNGYYVR